jgi:hypothetical protein
MPNAPFEKEIDPNPLVATLIEKTREGKLKWEATSAENTFIVSMGGGTTLRITLAQEWTIDEYGSEVQITLPQLFLQNEKGLTLWVIYNSEVKSAGLWMLFKLARRVANNIDERFADLIGFLEKL